MSDLTLKAPPQVLPQTDLERLSNAKADTPEAEKAKLRKASKQFESFFMYYMLKTMRETVSETSLAGGSPFSGGMGKDVFTQMFDMEISKSMVKGNSGSISDLLYKSLERTIETTSEKATPVEGAPIPLNTLKESAPTELEPRKIELKREADNKPDIQPLTPDFISIGQRPHIRQAQSIREQYGMLIDAAAKENDLDSSLIQSVIEIESAGNSRAQSSAGAKGLMQLMDSTAADLGVQDVFDPAENIRAGSQYLRSQLDKFGDLKLALAAYNAGPGNVAKHGGIPPFRETERYVAQVLNSYETLSAQKMSAKAKGRP
jgi:Rod binding domain-containing protein